MLFSSFAFIFVFLPIVWIVFHLLKSNRFATLCDKFCARFHTTIDSYKIAKIFLILSSLFFYAFWKVAYLPIMLGSIIVNYFLAKRILRFAQIARQGGGENCLLDRFTPKFFFIIGIIFNLSLLCFFKYTDFLLENFNAFSQIAHLDFEIPLPHILLPLALSFVTFQQIAFLFDCYKHATGQSNENLNTDFIDYALFISFFPQLIAGPIVHHREMMPQFATISNSSLGNHCGDLSPNSISSSLRDSAIAESKQSKNSPSFANFIPHPKSLPQGEGLAFDSPSLAEGARGWVKSTQKSIDCHDSTTKVAESRNDKAIINYEYLAKGIFIFSIGLFKKVFIADSFAKWANAGFGIAENGGHLNIAESWATSLSYTFQLYFDFSGYCDMAMGLALMFGIILPLNFNSPYKSLNIADFWRRWHITLGRFLKECLYIPLGGNRGKKRSNVKQNRGRILDEKSGLCSCERGNKTDSLLTKRTTNLPDLSPKANATTLRNLFIVAFLSGIWHGAGWGFVIWGVLHGVAMVIHRIYAWWIDSLNVNISSLLNSQRESKQSKNSPSLAEGDKGGGLKAQKNVSAQFLNHKSTHPLAPSAREGGQVGKSRFIAFTQSKIYKCLCWFITFNFINIAWIFFRAENVSGALNLLKGMFGIVWVDLPQKWHRIAQISGQSDTIFYIIVPIIVCLACKNSIQITQNYDRFTLLKSAFATILIIASFGTMLFANRKVEFLYFNF